MTNIVYFPSLGWEFTLNRVAIEVLGRPIYWYGIIIALGFMLGTMACARMIKRYGLSEDIIYDFMFFAVPAALVGLRTYYVIFYLDLFKKTDGSLDWGAIFRISDGGMAIYGGIIAGFITLYYFSRARKVKFFVLADVLVIGLILGQGIGRWGNFMNVEAYGGLTDGPWRMSSSSIASEMVSKGYATVEQGYGVLDGTLGVHPTFFYESAWNFVGVVLLYSIWKRALRFDGQICFSYLLWYGIGRFIIEGMRTDSLYFFGLSFLGYPLRTSQMLSLAMVIVAGGVLVLAFAGKLPRLYPVQKIEEE